MGAEIKRTHREPQQSFAPAKATRSFDVVVEQLRQRIVSGALKPGDRLPSERDMAAQFEVSRNMVREALRMLESYGMVELRSGALGGAFIASGRTEFLARGLSDIISVGGFSLSDLLEARQGLSGIIVGLAAEHATSADLVDLESNVERAQEAASDGAWNDVAMLNIEFHLLLARATSNPVLEMLQHSIMLVMTDVSLTTGPIKSDVTIRSRKRFLKMLRARRVADAVGEMDANLERVHAYFLAHSAGTKYAEPAPD